MLFDTEQLRQRAHLVFGIGLHVGDFGDRAGGDGPRRSRAAAGFHREGAADQLDRLRRQAVMRLEMQQRPVEQVDIAVARVAEPRRARDDRIQHRLDVGRRLRDHAQYVAGRGLLLEGLPQLAVARLDFFEQAHVANGDQRLVGKILRDGDLPLGERYRVGARQREHGLDDAGMLERHGEGGALVAVCGALAVVAHEAKVARDVVDVDDLSGIGGCRGHRMRVGSLRERRLARRLDPVAGVSELRGKAERIALAQPDRADIGFAQPDRGADQRVQHRLQLVVRAADRLQHFGRHRLLLLGDVEPHRPVVDPGLEPLVALLQQARHRVEFFGQRADLVAAPDGNALRQVAFAEPLGAQPAAA